MRFLFLFPAFIGVVLAVVYPFAVQNFGVHELARYRIYSKSDGFLPVKVELSAEEAPVRVLVDFATTAKIDAAPASAWLAVTVLRNGQRESEGTLQFIRSTPEESGVHSGGFVYRATGGSIHPVGTETYSFVFSPMSGATLMPETVEMILHTSTIGWDPRAQLLGYVLMAAGLIGFVVSRVGRGRTPDRP